MNIAEELQIKVRDISPPLARKVLDFIDYLEQADQRDQEQDPLKYAQQLSMNKVWDNPTDEVWNDL